MSTLASSRQNTPDRRVTPVLRREYPASALRRGSAERSRFCKGLSTDSNGTQKHASGDIACSITGKEKGMKISPLRSSALFSPGRTTGSFPQPPCTPKQTDLFWSRMWEDNAQRAHIHKVICESKGIRVASRERPKSRTPQRNGSTWHNKPTRQVRAGRSISPEKVLRGTSLSLTRVPDGTPRRNTSSVMRAVSIRSQPSPTTTPTAASSAAATGRPRVMDSTARRKRPAISAAFRAVGPAKELTDVRQSPDTVLLCNASRGSSARAPSALMNCRTDTAPYVEMSGDDMSTRLSPDGTPNPRLLGY